MTNRISMVKNDIVTLCKHGFSHREVARKLITYTIIRTKIWDVKKVFHRVDAVSSKKP